MFKCTVSDTLCSDTGSGNPPGSSTSYSNGGFYIKASRLGYCVNMLPFYPHVILNSTSSVGIEYPGITAFDTTSQNLTGLTKAILVLLWPKQRLCIVGIRRLFVKMVLAIQQAVVCLRDS